MFLEKSNQNKKRLWLTNCQECNKMSVKNTLHSNYRKRELDKIEAENYKLAQKLFSLKSDLTKK